MEIRLTLEQFIVMQEKFENEFPDTCLDLTDGNLRINYELGEFPISEELLIERISFDGVGLQPAFEWVKNYLQQFNERNEQMKGDISFKIAFVDPTVSYIRAKVKEQIGMGYCFRINSYKVTYVSANEAKVDVQYTRYPKKIKIDTSNIEVSHNIFDGLQKDMKENSFKGLNEAIVNALDNYYE